MLLKVLSYCDMELQILLLHHRHSHQNHLRKVEVLDQAAGESMLLEGREEVDEEGEGELFA